MVVLMKRTDCHKSNLFITKISHQNKVVYLVLDSSQGSKSEMIEKLKMAEAKIAYSQSKRQTATTKEEL